MAVTILWPPMSDHSLPCLGDASLCRPNTAPFWYLVITGASKLLQGWSPATSDTLLINGRIISMSLSKFRASASLVLDFGAKPLRNNEEQMIRKIIKPPAIPTFGRDKAIASFKLNW
eukprot:CAMPEP_0171314486 /NCGR_PEP_ID=MMETSP0816-20121228/52870_1 /TAXON_ID=420281 /ORGANISM="Proboscia inermis, Strain CCAP1064/1" /LENGTH=116 /DNA_ID=CAMNT_0011803547 /DNA_START=674 /DNA_END=1021 /DNA_ORIENTATION=+